MGETYQSNVETNELQLPKETKTNPTNKEVLQPQKELLQQIESIHKDFLSSYVKCKIK